MVGKWAKAVFLALIGVVLLLYADKFVQDLKNTMSESFDVAFEWTWDLLTILLWVLVAWLFVDAILTVAVSFQEHRYSLVDVVRRLERIEGRLGIEASADSKPRAESVDEEAPAIEEEIPPPPPPPPKE